MEPDENIMERLGVSSLRREQKEVLDRIFSSGKDFFAVMPTGSGKTLCFMYYALAAEGITILVYPLLSLMNDQIARFRRAKISASVLRGGQTRTQREQALSLMGPDGKRVKAVITNPETLCSPGVMRRLETAGKLSFVFDEAHSLVEWGETFRSAMLGVKGALERLNVQRILAFTATADAQTIERFCAHMPEGRAFERVIFSANRPNIFYKRRVTSSRILSVLEAVEECEKPCIVFANSRAVTRRLALLLSEKFPFLDVRHYHAGMGKSEREKTESWFLSSANGLLVSTCAFGMGVDKADIRTSIHFTLPDSASSFLQESGRIGRDGRPAVSYAIAKRSELVFCKSRKRRELLSVFLGKECMRRGLLEAMGEDAGIHRIRADDCSGCDACARKASAEDRNPELDEVGQMVFAFLCATKRALDENSSILALLGVRSKRVRHSWMIPFFGALADVDRRIVFESVHEMHLLKKRHRFISV